jgi:type III restriction enzyme
MLYRFMENKPGINYAPVFTALLGVVDEAAKGMIIRKLQQDLPAKVPDQNAWFTPYLRSVDEKQRLYYENMANNLKRTLVFGNGLSPLGLLRSCLDHALDDSVKIGGVFENVRLRFRSKQAQQLYKTVERMNSFRNTQVVHQQKELNDRQVAQNELKVWIEGTQAITEA